MEKRYNAGLAEHFYSFGNELNKFNNISEMNSIFECSQNHKYFRSLARASSELCKRPDVFMIP